MKVLIITPRWGGPFKSGAMLANYLNKHNIRAKHVSGLCKTIFSLFTFNPEIIHSSSPITWFLWKKPYVLTVKGNYKKELTSRIWFWENAIKNAAIVHTNTNFLKRVLGLKNAVVIPNTIKIKKIKKIPQKGLKLLTVTSFDFPLKTKGLLDLLRIIKEVCEANKIKAELRVVGGGKNFGGIVIPKSNFLKITLLGKQLHEKVEEELSKADIFVYNSYLDNFPNVFLEAMLFRLPIITNNVGGAKEIVSNDCVAKTRQDYKNKLVKLLTDKKHREKLSKYSKTRIKDFDENKVLKGYIKLYLTL